ncbi:MAG TPA: TIGR03016 family PEP-CTERM system-associated outer membrane protein, partial [Caulobacteraceae bacterium]|nr:TIGR03016 family PEP-CTERM system-associated outer membrane protein [Caulobacteraceae bacterium]
TRRMRPDLTLMLRADYARTPESPTYGPSDAAGGAVQIAYRLNSRTDLTLSFAHTQTRQLVQGGERVTENALFETLRRAF